MGMKVVVVMSEHQQQQQQEQHHQMMMMDLIPSPGIHSDHGGESRPAPVVGPFEMRRSSSNPSSCRTCGLGCARKFLWIVMGTLSLVFLLRSEGEASANMRSNLQQSMAAISFTKQQLQLQEQQSNDLYDHDDDSDNDQRPYFILHVGLQKTGTTFLQFTLCSDVAQQILRQDNYDFLGMCARGGPAADQQQQRHDNDYAAAAATVGRSRLFFSANATYANLPQLIPDFLHSILAAKEAGRGLILSDENMSMSKS
jgi:hypothetical protein